MSCCCCHVLPSMSCCCCHVLPCHVMLLLCVAMSCHAAAVMCCHAMSCCCHVLPCHVGLLLSCVAMHVMLLLPCVAMSCHAAAVMCCHVMSCCCHVWQCHVRLLSPGRLPRPPSPDTDTTQFFDTSFHLYYLGASRLPTLPIHHVADLAGVIQRSLLFGVWGITLSWATDSWALDSMLAPQSSPLLPYFYPPSTSAIIKPRDWHPSLLWIGLLAIPPTRRRNGPRIPLLLHYPSARSSANWSSSLSSGASMRHGRRSMRYALDPHHPPHL